MKVGYCCLYGLANAGKSTLLNAILGLKIEAVSPKAQTTRYNVQGIYTDDEAQIVFIDTPGLHKPHGKLGNILLEDAEDAKDSVDVLLYVVDASNRQIDENVIKKVNAFKGPVVLIYNKIDKVGFEEGQKRLEEYKKRLPQAETVEMSALNKVNVDQMISLIKTHLPEGDLLYPKDQLIDRPTRFVWAEMIREKCMLNLDEELPHAVHVEITHTEYDEKLQKQIIYADIIVEKDSEKAIVIGKQGKKLSLIRKHAEHSISNFMQEKVALELYVKVVEDWRNDPRKLKEYGYEDK